jgi:hypothetical protein
LHRAHSVTAGQVQLDERLVRAQDTFMELYLVPWKGAEPEQTADHQSIENASGGI